MSPELIGFSGVLIGAVTTLAGTYFLDYRRETRATRALASALSAEVRAILHVEQEHDLRAMYQEVLDKLKHGKNVQMPNIGYSTNPTRSVYYSNLSRIGILPPEASEKMVRLSYVFEVIATDRMCMDKGEWNAQDLPRRIEMLEHHLETYDAFVELANAAILCLEQ